MPAQEVVDPTLDREEIMAELLDRQLGTPSIVDQRRHSHFAMLRVAFVAMQQNGGEHIVSIGEDVGLDRCNLTCDALRREASVIDDRRNTFNDDAAASVKTGSGHELASCELHASAKRALGGDRIVKFEKALPVATHHE